MKFYRSDRFYFKVIGSQTEKISSYKHCYGIERTLIYFDTDEMEQITEAQYNRIKRLILAKLLEQ